MSVKDDLDNLINSRKEKKSNLDESDLEETKAIISFKNKKRLNEGFGLKKKTVRPIGKRNERRSGGQQRGR